MTTTGFGPYGEPNSWGGSRFAYTGQIQIGEVQLYHYKARVYDPVSGRFLQADPSGYDGGVNLYLYADDDPTDLSDSDGLSSSRSSGGFFSSFASAYERGGELQFGQELKQASLLETAQGRRDYLNQGAIGLTIGGTLAAATTAMLEVGTAFTVETTLHGLARVGGASARGGTLSSLDVGVTRLFGQRLTQADGATVFMRTLSNGRVNALVQNSAGKIITTFKNFTPTKIAGLAARYG